MNKKPPPPKQQWNNFGPSSPFIFVIILIALMMLLRFNVNQPREIDIPYSEFMQNVRAGRIANVTITPDLIRGELTAPDGEVKRFRTLPLNDPNLIESLEAAGVEPFSGAASRNWFWAVFMSWGPMILFILFLFWFYTRMQNGGKQAMNFGKSKARLANQGVQKITFKDVAGAGEAKEELEEIIQFLKNPAKFQKLGGKIPKGVLLVGSPGTGKTLLAKAVAGEAGVPFFSSSGSEFVEMFVGVGASRVRDLFDNGRKFAPCLLFIDEIDAVGRQRFAGIGGGHDEREQTLNQLLVEMDGFDSKEGVILIASTNRPDVLDPALLRPGRFDRQVVVPVPDLKDREEILKVHAKKVKLEQKVDLAVVARRTPGFTGADLANVVNESALLAARKDHTAVTEKDLEEAIERIIAGPQRKSRIISEKEKNIIAYHEAGHALVAKKLPCADTVHKVTIIPRGPALGYTLQLPNEDKFLTSKTELESRLAILLAGRAAEEIVFNEITTGAQNDIMKATEIATRMVTEFGMSEKVGLLALGRENGEVFLGRDFSRNNTHSEKTNELIDAEVKAIIDTANEKAKKILSENMGILKTFVDKLIERENLNCDEVEKIMKGEELPPFEKAVPPQPSAEAQKNAETPKDKEPAVAPADAQKEQPAAKQKEGQPEASVSAAENTNTNPDTSANTTDEK
ncbi:MAG: ATP-dependent zinc metalloprotease FtsH [Elusimicrobia bacterium]|nr:ATP-dependent zinc metalloprotease FtsH [Elusimicrobiota bacterium]